MSKKQSQGHLELYRKHRPMTLKEIIGQPNAVEVLGNKFKAKQVPHAMMFSGPTGCGKTTLARIVANQLECDDHCFLEINASDFKGIDTVRSIKGSMGFYGMGKSSIRVYLFDEVHKMTSDAQNAMLKMLEDPPAHVYFILATSDPDKVLKTVRGRCLELVLQQLSNVAIEKIVKSVAAKEKIKLRPRAMRRLIEASEGSGRKALVILESLVGVKEPKRQLKLIEKNDSRAPAINIARALLNRVTVWSEMAQILRDNMNEDAEGMRHMVLGYCTSILLNGKPDPRAALVIECFQDSFYESKKAGLVVACWNVVNTK